MKGSKQHFQKKKQSLLKLTAALMHAISVPRAAPIECVLVRNWVWLLFSKRTLFIKRNSLQFTLISTCT